MNIKQLDTSEFSKHLDRITSLIPVLGSRIHIASNNEIALETGFPILMRTQDFAEEPTGLFQSEKFLDMVNNITGEPLIKVLVTQTPRNTFIGFSFSHMLGDGASFFQFVKDLSKLCLHQNIECELSNARELLQTANVESRTSPSLFEATGYVVPRPPNPKHFVLEKIEFSTQKLIELKEFCKHQGFEVTSNDILMADLAKRYH